MTGPRVFLVAVCASSLLLTGCGGGTQELSSSAATVLKGDADALAAAARQGDSVAVQSALAALRRDVGAQKASGDVSAARAAQVLDAGARVAADVPVPRVTPSPTPTPSATPSEHGDKGDGEKKGKGEGKH